MRLTKPHLWDNQVFYYYPFQYINYVICVPKNPRQRLLVYHTKYFRDVQTNIYEELQPCNY